MDQLGSTLLSFPPDAVVDDDETFDRLIKLHVGRLTKILKDRQSDLASHGVELLEVLNPSIHSLSYLVVLSSLVIPSPVTTIPRDVLLEKLVTFLVCFDDRQLRYGGQYVLDLLTAVGNGQLLPASVAVETLATAILKLDPSGSLLTSSHILLAKLAYNTNEIDRALPVIDKNIVFYPGMANHSEVSKLICDRTMSPPGYISKEQSLTSNLKAKDVLEYDLICGLMYCSRRDWAKASAAFERAITYPTKEGGTSKIMVEAYKKWILVSLLLDGRASEPPSTAGGNAKKLYETLGKSYTSLASLFDTENAQTLREEAEKNLQTWQEDANMGLVQEVLAAYHKWQVLNLQHVYSKISIPEIRQQTKSAETGDVLPQDIDVENLIQNMIISGMLKGVIEKNDDGVSYLSFLPPSTQLSEQAFAKELAGTAVRLKALQPVFKATSERLSTHKDYIKHVLKEKHRSEDNKNSGASDPNMAFGMTVDDEDLMGGLGP